MNGQAPDFEAWEPPTSSDIDQVVVRLGEPQYARLFFGQLENPRWLLPLRDKGYFRRAPAPERLPDGYVRFPPWFEGDYLMRMAAVIPGDVADVLAKVDDNGHMQVHAVTLEAAVAMPPEVAAKLVPRIVHHLGGWTQLNVDHLVALMRRMASATPPLVREVRQLASAAFGPRPRSARSDEQAVVRPEPVAGLEEYAYERGLPGAVMALEAAMGTDVISVLAGWLTDATKASGYDGHDLSSIWRPSVAPHAQNLEHGIRHAIINATRDAASAMVRAHPDRLSEVVRQVEASPTTISRRIALHVLARAVADGVAGARELGEARLMDSVLLDGTYRHEYAELARALLPDSSEELARRWLDMAAADRQTSDGDIRRWLARDQRSPEEVTDDEIARYRRIGLRELLTAVEPALPAPLAAELSTLNAKLGPRPEGRPADFSSWSETFTGPVTPASAADLAAMSGQELVDYLANWQPPTDDWRGPSREGLGRQLTDVIRANPSQLGDIADRLASVHPTYVSSALRGWELALKDGKPVNWPAIVSLLDFVSQQPDEGDGVGLIGTEDPGWRWSQQEAARLLRTGLLASEDLRPTPDLRERVWECLLRLAESPNPSPEHEARYGGDNMDPLTLSLNTVRPQAITAVIAYLSWLVATGQVTAGGAPGETAPEVWPVLDAHLDPRHDPSPAVRSVYGQDFPFLSYVSPEWARASAESLFGVATDADESERRDAAWVAYVTMHNPSERTLLILLPVYQARVRERDRHLLTPKGADHAPAARTAEHVLLMLALGLIDIDSDDGLVRAYFETADVDSRAHALGHLGWLLFRQEEPLPDEAAERLQRLWDWRRSEVTSKGETAELTQFGWWFRSGKFPRAWLVERMAKVARSGHPLRMPALIAEDVEAFAQEFPAECLDILQGLLDGSDTWALYATGEHAPPVLAAAIATGDPTLRERAEAVLDRLGRAGFLDAKVQVDQLLAT